MTPHDDLTFLLNSARTSPPLREAVQRVEAHIATLTQERDDYRIEADHGHDDYEDAEAVIRQIAEGRPNERFDPWARELCRAFVERPSRSRATIADIRERAEAAEAALAEAQQENERLRGDSLCPDCGIPEMWCRLVSTNASHCWRWDDEARRTAETALADTRRALEKIADGRWNQGSGQFLGGAPNAITSVRNFARRALAATENVS